MAKFRYNVFDKVSNIRQWTQDLFGFASKHRASQAISVLENPDSL
jgi:hypothetical protein